PESRPARHPRRGPDRNTRAAPHAPTPDTPYYSDGRGRRGLDRARNGRPTGWTVVRRRDTMALRGRVGPKVRGHPGREPCPPRALALAPRRVGDGSTPLRHAHPRDHRTAPHQEPPPMFHRLAPRRATAAS